MTGSRKSAHPQHVFGCSRCDHLYRSPAVDRTAAATQARLNGWSIDDMVLCPGCASVATAKAELVE